MKEQTYYVPALVVGSVMEKRAKDPRMGSKKPPLRAAYVHLLRTGLERMKAFEFWCAVTSNLIRVDVNDKDCWQKTNLPVPAELHAQLKEVADFEERRLYDLCHAIFLEAEKEFEYSAVEQERPEKFKYWVFDWDGNFWGRVDVYSDKEFDRWNEQNLKPGLKTSGIRIFSNNPKTQFASANNLRDARTKVKKSVNSKQK
jgi:hypothetical protein